jgi:hypothetical protein
MRALAACLTVFLGLGAMTALATTLAGCSDSTTTGGSGGASGASTTAGASSGGASAGSGGASCSFQSTACTTCLGTKCMDQVVACQADTDCKAALTALTPCVCGGTDVNTCAGMFATDGGDPALQLAQCYTLNCEAACM